MSATTRLLNQRSRGLALLHFGTAGVARLKESGCSKIRLPAGLQEAMLINTSGGLAGGDRIDVEIAVAERADLLATSQAAERVYRSLGPPATVNLRLSVGQGASLAWLPLETIMFDGARLSRSFDVALAGDARFTAVEAIVLGRTESGEVVREMGLRDHWQVRRDGSLIHADILRIAHGPPNSEATLAGNRAFATLMHFADTCQATTDRLRHAVGDAGGVSAWNGKVIARLVAKDGFELRKALRRVLLALRGPTGLTKTWAM